MNAEQRQRIRNEILQLMTPPVSFQMKKPVFSNRVLGLITGICLLFSVVYFGQLTKIQNSLAFDRPVNSYIYPVSQSINNIKNRLIPVGKTLPKLPDIEVIYVES